MVKRKPVEYSSDDEDYGVPNVASSSPERPLQTARRTGKKAKTRESGGESEGEAPQAAKKLKLKSKSRSTKPPVNPPKGSSPDSDEDTGEVQAGVNERGERYVELGKKRRATVNTFKGGKYLDIREFYGDEGDLKPGKKGISLSQEQWETLKKGSDVIDSFFARLK